MPLNCRTRWTTDLLWVAQAHGEPMGFLAACKGACGLHILEISVLPRHGRKGVGTRLLETATREARNRRLASERAQGLAHHIAMQRDAA